MTDEPPKGGPEDGEDHHHSGPYERKRLRRSWWRQKPRPKRNVRPTPAMPRPHVRVWRWRLPVPRSRTGRTILGVTFIVVGTLGFAMPVIGLWMWGPGMLILSIDSHRVRRFRRRSEVRAIRWWRKRRRRRTGSREERTRKGRNRTEGRHPGPERPGPNNSGPNNSGPDNTGSGHTPDDPS